MAITLERLRQRMHQATGYDETPPGFELEECAVECLELFGGAIGYAPWRERRFDGRLTSSGDSVALPAEANQVLGAWMFGDPVHQPIVLIDPLEFETRKDAATNVTGGRLIGTVRTESPVEGETEPRPTLTVHPPVTTAGQKPVTVIYNGQPKRPTPDQPLDVPQPLEAIFFMFWRSWCVGTMLKDRRIEDELEVLRRSREWRDSYAMVNPRRRLGPNENGMVGQYMARREGRADLDSGAWRRPV